MVWRIVVFAAVVEALVCLLSLEAANVFGWFRLCFFRS